MKKINTLYLCGAVFTHEKEKKKKKHKKKQT